MAIIDFNATKCKHCYKCVRNCEVKAIMIKDGRLRSAFSAEPVYRSVPSQPRSWSAILAR